jgi:NADH-quinone oxidoreductase subunit N
VSAVASGGNDRGLLWLVILALTMSAVSLYYYLRVLKHVFVEPRSEDIGSIQSPLSTVLCISVLALLTILLGCAPSALLDWIQKAISTTT